MNTTDTVPYRFFSVTELEDLARRNHWDKAFAAAVIERAAAHYYVDQKTGSRYRDGSYLRSTNHWDRKEPLHVVLDQTDKREPVVRFETGLGNGALYRPEHLRALAATLKRIADDAEAAPMGPRSFHSSDRGYDVTE